MNEPFETNDEVQSEEPRRRSIRQIPIPENRKLRRGASRQEDTFPKEDVSQMQGSSMADDMRRREPEYEEAPSEEHYDTSYNEGYFSQAGRKSSWWKWVIALVVIVGIFAVVSLVFKKATVYVTAKEVVTNAPVTLALQNGSGYTPISATITEKETLAATTESEVQRKASGSITIYNDFGAESQELIATTRFESPDGLIFRIPDAVVVPGNTTQGDKTIPGKAEAVVVADKAGSEYNINGAKFTIPGFEGSPKFTAFWAESTKPMSGGFIGKVKTITKTEQEAAVARLRAKIEGRIQGELARVAGEDNIILGIPPTVSFSEPKVSESNGQVVVEITATVNAFAANESDLASAIIASVTGKVPNQGSVLEFAGGTPAITAELQDGVVSVTVPQAVIAWKVDTNAVANAVLGKSKGDISRIAGNFEAVSSMRADLKPNWARSFPTDKEKVEVVVE